MWREWVFRAVILCFVSSGQLCFAEAGHTTPAPIKRSSSCARWIAYSVFVVLPAMAAVYYGTKKAIELGEIQRIHSFANDFPYPVMRESLRQKAIEAHHRGGRTAVVELLGKIDLGFKDMTAYMQVPSHQNFLRFANGAFEESAVAPYTSIADRTRHIGFNILMDPQTLPSEGTVHERIAHLLKQLHEGARGGDTYSQYMPDGVDYRDILSGKVPSDEMHRTLILAAAWDYYGPVSGMHPRIRVGNFIVSGSENPITVQTKKHVWLEWGSLVFDAQNYSESVHLSRYYQDHIFSYYDDKGVAIRVSR